MTKQVIIIFLFIFSLNAVEWMTFEEESTIITSTKQIHLEDYPHAFNPSIFKVDKGFLLSFRYIPNVNEDLYLNYIGLVLLDENLEMIAKPHLLSTRSSTSKTKSQSEDARIFSFLGRTFLIYNDNIDMDNPSIYDRRDMFISELFISENGFSLSAPIKLICEEKYGMQYWQKNWSAFEWQNKLMISYSLNPHEVLYTNLFNGNCYLCYSTWADIDWNWGTLRGSASPVIVDGEYLSFFHSGKVVTSPASWGYELWHYFMGAYTFSLQPPFEITKISPKPIFTEGFYTQSYCPKRVIFPGGFVIDGNLLYLAYGKDDEEIWIATLDLKQLKNSLVPVHSH